MKALPTKNRLDKAVSTEAETYPQKDRLHPLILHTKGQIIQPPHHPYKNNEILQIRDHHHHLFHQNSQTNHNSPTQTTTEIPGETSEAPVSIVKGTEVSAEIEDHSPLQITKQPTDHLTVEITATTDETETLVSTEVGLSQPEIPPITDTNLDPQVGNVIAQTPHKDIATDLIADLTKKIPIRQPTIHHFTNQFYYTLTKLIRKTSLTRLITRK